jgi:capsid assembly protease
MSILIRIAERVLNRPLMILPDKLALIASVLEGRIGIDATELKDLAQAGPDASRFSGSYLSEDGQRTKHYRVDKGVAMIPVLGSLVNRGAWLGARSGMTSYEGLGFQLAQATADSDVKTIILDIDSPGGEAVGAFEMADKVRAVAKSKPVVAVVNGMAASAAYAIASAASQIVATPSGVAGSIGVVLMHADYSVALHQKGIKPTLIHAGAHKVDGNPYEPLSDNVKFDLQAEVDSFYSLFVSSVAQGRKGRMTEKAIRSTEARTYIGQAALDAGLVDAIGSFETVLADLSKRSTTSKTPVRQSSGLALEQQLPAVAAVAPSMALESAPGPEAGLRPGLGSFSAKATTMSTLTTSSPAGPSTAEIAAAAIDALPTKPDPASIAASWDEAITRLKGKNTLPLAHGWDRIIADVSEYGYSRAELAHGWGEIVEAINGTRRGPKFKLGFGWDDVITKINAEASAVAGEDLRAIADKSDFGWSGIVAKVNSKLKGRT